jgi:hypothetical protein
MIIDKVREQELEETKMCRKTARYISRVAQERLLRLELISLGLTILASGSLYVALLKQFPQAMVWLGAILSTLSALVGGYVRLRGYLKTTYEATSLQDKLTELLIKYTKAPDMPRGEFRAEQKKLEEECAKLEGRSGIHMPTNAT